MMSDPSRGRADSLLGAERKTSDPDCISQIDRTSPGPNKAGKAVMVNVRARTIGKTCLTRPGPKPGVGKGRSQMVGDT